MKILLTRSSILRATVIFILLAALPSAIRRLIQTRDLYLFTERFFDDVLARFSGPGRLRFIVQPIVAILLGARDGVKDARAGLPAFPLALAFHGQHRREMLRSAFASVADLVAIAILVDLVAQYLIFRQIRPGAALLVGPILIGLPYSLGRASRNWISRHQRHRDSLTM